MNLKTHERIVREALTGRVSAEGLKWIVTANLHCDLYQLTPERHFDNAPDRETLGRLWAKGLNRYYLRALDLTQGLSLRRRRALEAFGEASHALADFYAHTDWVEIQAARGVRDALAPLLESTFEIEKFPSEIQSGYYSLRFGLKGCPHRNGLYEAPSPFKYCHETIAKDHGDRGHGAEPIEPGGPTYYEQAVRLATRATIALWERFCREAAERSGDPGLDSAF